jgi:CheY-like chemotaxis protein/HPt (histidine-containing phosphotransfer) domain-containing protein
MSESKNFRIALLSGGLSEWSESVTPMLLARTNSLVVLETVTELLALNADSKPEIIFICHQPGRHDGIAAAEIIRVLSPETPLLLLADENFDTLKAALTVGALAILSAPFSEKSFIPAFERSAHLADSLRSEAHKSLNCRNIAELFMLSPCCHIFVNDANSKATAINGEAARILGISAGVMPSFTEICKRFFAPHASTYPHDLETAVECRTLWQGILSGHSSDGTLRIYQIICAPMNLSDGISGMLLTLHDITKEESDLANMRISLQAAADCLSMASFSEHDSAIKAYCFSDEDFPLKAESFSLSTLLESVSKNMKTVNVTIPDYIPKYFRGDATRVESVLGSLIKGSAAFGNSTPKISINIKEKTPSGMGIQFSISIENSSIKTQSYQNSADYLSSVSGNPEAASGIGLAAVIIKQLKGSMLVRTEPGNARTVICNIPLVPESGDGQAHKTTSPSTGFLLNLDAKTETLPSLKILVAEDNFIEQTALKHLLESVGCQVIIVSNGKEAVDEFETGEFDIVLMDILMPEMDGFEATRLIRERERITGGRVPVIALTSYSLKAVQDKCVSVGMNGYLAKPVAKKKLVEALQSIGMMQDKSSQYEEVMSGLNDLPVLEARTILENIGYDLDLYRELVKMYLESYAAHGDELASRLGSADIEEILNLAHALKGIVSNIGGERLAEAARHIQDMCREGNKPDSKIWAPIIEAQTAALKLVLEDLDWSVLETFIAESDR